MAEKKFDIVYEISANTSKFRNAVKGVTTDIQKMSDAIDNSQEHLKSLLEDKGKSELLKEFEKTVQTAEKLKSIVTTLNATPKTKGNENVIAGMRMSLAAGKRQYTAEMEAAAKAVSANTTENIVAARYALYDMANEARRVGLAMSGIGIAAVKVAADFESAFINVARTSSGTSKEIETLRNQLLDISKTTPIGFDDISKIATLANQMGIASENTAQFSENIAKFSTVTGISAESASAAFGRIAELLNVSKDQYDNLASSVLYAGNNSVATEEEVLNLTTQIAASAAQAGMAADETIGLATALASLRIAPEQARGVILRLFADFDVAIAENGERLNDYASVLGTTAAEASNLWKTNPSGFFTRFVGSLSGASAAGKDVNVILQQLGITETRETNVLQRLAGNYDVLTKSLNDAKTSYGDGTEVNKQFGQVASTLASKLQTLINNILALADSMGKELLPVIGPIIDFLSGIISLISSNPNASFLVGLGVAAATAMGAVILFKAAVWQATASTLAMREALKALGIEEGKQIIGVGLLREQFNLLTGGTVFAKKSADSFSLSLKEQIAVSETATWSARALSLALKALPWVAVASTVAAFIPTNEQATESVKSQTEALITQAQALDNVAQSDLFSKKISLESVFAGFGRGIGIELNDVQINLKQLTNAFGDTRPAEQFFKSIDDGLTEMAKSGNKEKALAIYDEMRKSAIDAGVPIQVLKSRLNDFFKELPNAPASAEALKSLTDAEIALQNQTDVTADEIKNRLSESFLSGNKSALSMSSALMDFSTALQQSGGSIDAFSTGGAKSLSAFNNLIEVVIQAAGNDLPRAIAGSAAAIGMIEQAGGDASTQMAGLVERINSMFGLNLNPATITSLKVLQSEIMKSGTIAASTKAQIASLLGGGEFANLFSSALKMMQKTTSSAASSTKKTIKSVFDYASSIGSILNNVTKLAFGFSAASDEVASGWNDTRDRIEKAKQSLIDLKREQQDLVSDRATLEYQLNVATRYGDTKRIAVLTKQIADNNAKIADKEKEIAATQAEASTTLKGTSKEAIQNRADIRARVDDAKALVEAYASTVKANGKLPTDAEIKAYAQSVSANFVTQATSIGYAASELTDYATLISGFGKAAAVVEQPNVKVKLNPVTTAIDAYLAKEKESKTKLTTDVGSTNELQAIYDKLLKALKIPTVVIDTTIDIPDWKRLQNMAKGFFRGSPLYEYFMELSADAKKAIAGGVSRSRLMYASGGYVQGPGTATSDSITASLSNGEFVMNAASVAKYGVGFFNALNQQRITPTGFTAGTVPNAGSSSSSVVYLSPDDRALLRAAIDRPINLYTDNAKIAQSANAGNVVLAQRGTN